MEFNFNSKLIISTNGILNPEYPCGKIIFNFFVDLKNNNFKFNNFELSYDLDKCDEHVENNNEVTNEVTNEAPNAVGSKMNLKYAMPVALGIGGIVATPFLLGALGGKKSFKTRRRIRSKKQKKMF